MALTRVHIRPLTILFVLALALFYSVSSQQDPCGPCAESRLTLAKARELLAKEQNGEEGGGKLIKKGIKQMLSSVTKSLGGLAFWRKKNGGALAEENQRLLQELETVQQQLHECGKRKGAKTLANGEAGNHQQQSQTATLLQKTKNFLTGQTGAGKGGKKRKGILKRMLSAIKRSLGWLAFWRKKKGGQLAPAEEQQQKELESANEQLLAVKGHKGAKKGKKGQRGKAAFADMQGERATVLDGNMAENQQQQQEQRESAEQHQLHTANGQRSMGHSAFADRQSEGGTEADRTMAERRQLQQEQQERAKASTRKRKQIAARRQSANTISSGRSKSSTVGPGERVVNGWIVRDDENATNQRDLEQKRREHEATQRELEQRQRAYETNQREREEKLRKYETAKATRARQTSPTIGAGERVVNGYIVSSANAPSQRETEAAEKRKAWERAYSTQGSTTTRRSYADVAKGKHHGSSKEKCKCCQTHH